MRAGRFALVTCLSVFLSAHFSKSGELKERKKNSSAEPTHKGRQKESSYS